MKRFPLWFITLGLATGAVYYLQPGARTQKQSPEVAAVPSAATVLPPLEKALPQVTANDVLKTSTATATAATATDVITKQTRPETAPRPRETEALRKPNPSVTINPGLTSAASMAQPKISDDEANGYAALELAQHMEGRERINTVREGITLLANANVSRAVAIANELTNQHDHGVAVGTVVRLVAERNPRQAAEILFEQVPPETALALIQYPRTAEVMRQVVDVQVQADPMTAVRWAEQMGANESGRAARDIVRSAWAAAEPEAAMSWAQSMPDAVNRARILETMQPQIQPPPANSGAASWAQPANHSPIPPSGAPATKR